MLKTKLNEKTRLMPKNQPLLVNENQCSNNNSNNAIQHTNDHTPQACVISPTPNTPLISNSNSEFSEQVNVSYDVSNIDSKSAVQVVDPKSYAVHEWGLEPNGDIHKFFKSVFPHFEETQWQYVNWEMCKEHTGWSIVVVIFLFWTIACHVVNFIDDFTLNRDDISSSSYTFAIFIVYNLDQLFYLVLAIAIVYWKGLWYHRYLLFCGILVEIGMVIAEVYALGYPDVSSQYGIGVVVLMSVPFRDLPYYIVNFCWYRVFDMEIWRLKYVLIKFDPHDNGSLRLLEYFPHDTNLYIVAMVISVFASVAIAILLVFIVLESTSHAIFWIVMRLALPVVLNLVVLLQMLGRDRLVIKILARHLPKKNTTRWAGLQPTPYRDLMVLENCAFNIVWSAGSVATILLPLVGALGGILTKVGSG